MENYVNKKYDSYGLIFIIMPITPDNLTEALSGVSARRNLECQQDK